MFSFFLLVSCQTNEKGCTGSFCFKTACAMCSLMFWFSLCPCTVVMFVYKPEIYFISCFSWIPRSVCCKTMLKCISVWAGIEQQECGTWSSVQATPTFSISWSSVHHSSSACTNKMMTLVNIAYSMSMLLRKAGPYGSFAYLRQVMWTCIGFRAC